MCNRLEKLEIDVLAGANYSWSFQKYCTIRRIPDEPVAVETELGWVLSRPMRHQQGKEVMPTHVNLVTSVLDERIESEVQTLWDLEMLGIQSL